MKQGDPKQQTLYFDKTEISLLKALIAKFDGDVQRVAQDLHLPDQTLMNAVAGKPVDLRSAMDLVDQVYLKAQADERKSPATRAYWHRLTFIYHVAMRDQQLGKLDEAGVYRRVAAFAETGEDQ